jgi:hypothetical protein
MHQAAKPGRTANLLAWMVALGISFSSGAATEVDEYQLKAAFLYNFGKFVEWPPQAFNSPSDPFAVCVLGEDPFGRALIDVMNGKALKGRPFQIRQVPNAQQGSTCQILFISSSEQKRFRSILADLKASPVLTVGDTEGFAAAGGVANFTLDGDTVRIEINVEAAKQKNLLISSKLLSLARIVK